MVKLFKNKAFIALAILLVIITAVKMSSRGIPVQTASVIRGQIHEYVEERGKTTLPQIHTITMPFDGRLLSPVLKEGDTVRKGDIVARLERLNLESAANDLQSQLDAVNAEIEVSRYNAIEETALEESQKWIDSFGKTVQAAEKRVIASDARNTYAQWFLNSNEEMYSNDVISENELNKSRKDAAEEQVELQSDKLIYSSMQTMQEIIALMPVYIQQYLGRKVLSRKILEHKKKSLEVALEKARRDLGRTLIKSPIDGVVLKKHIDSEMVIIAGAHILDIGTISELEVTADILTLDSVKISTGDSVDIRLSAADKILHGTVDRIKPQAFTKVSSLGVEEQRVDVVVRFNEGELEKLNKAGGQLGVGYRVNVKIYTASSDNVLTIPRTSVFRGSGGNWEAFKIDNGSAKLVQLKIGLSNDRLVEITEGLAENDQIIIAPPASLIGGQRVITTKK